MSEALTGPRVLLATFYDVLLARGAAAALSPETRLADRDGYSLFYTPFEYVNATAHLALVGITPGPTQIALAYDKVQSLLVSNLPDMDVLREAKALASFGGPSMRPNLLRMLRHFHFDDILGVADVSDLWGARADLLHATSVVPHAAFRRGAMFAGSFQEVLASPVLRESFEQDFVGSLAGLNSDILFVALGPTPLAALDWCAARGHLRSDQILGAFAHPSSGGGSQVSVYLGEKRPDDLNPHDPVRGRLDFLGPAARRMSAATDALRIGASSPVPPVQRDSAITAALAAPFTLAEQPRQAAHADTTDTIGLYYVVSRGAKSGTVLRPHIHEDGHYVVSPTRFEKDYVRVPIGSAIEPYLRRGMSLRMSAPGYAPSLIAPASVRGRTLA